MIKGIGAVMVILAGGGWGMLQAAKIEALMQDALYRSYVAHRSMGYPQAPVPSYYLGDN